MNPKLFVLWNLFSKQFEPFPSCSSCLETTNGPPVCYNVKGNEGVSVEVTNKFCCENWEYWLMPVARRVFTYEEYIKLLLSKT